MENRGLGALGALALMPLLLGGCATTSAPPAYPVPEALKAPNDQGLSKQVHATGFQIYECKPSKADATRFEWALRGPEAELVDDTGKAAGKHYAGPTWEAPDGSKVVGVVVARDNGPDPAVDPLAPAARGLDGGAGRLQPGEERPAAAHRRWQGARGRLHAGADRADPARGLQRGLPLLPLSGQCDRSTAAAAACASGFCSRAAQSTGPCSKRRLSSALVLFSATGPHRVRGLCGCGRRAAVPTLPRPARCH